MMTTEQEQYIEEMAILVEKLGLTRSAGRIFGYVLMTHNEHPSADDFMKDLHMSKGSVSMGLKSLTTVGFLEAVSLKKSRKTHYQLAHQSMVDLMQQRNHMMTAIRDIYMKGYKLRNSQTDAQATWLKETAEFYDWLGVKVNELIEEWKQSIK
jgi:DNA-binding transcriptional regulator GbsR (MarR family)